AIGDIERSYAARVEGLVGAAEDGVIIHQTYQAGWRWSHPGGGDGHVESSMLIAMHWIRRHCESDLRRIETRRIDQLHQTVRTALVIAVCYVGCGDEVETVAQQARKQGGLEDAGLCSSCQGNWTRSQLADGRIRETNRTSHGAPKLTRDRGNELQRSFTRIPRILVWRREDLRSGGSRSYGLHQRR